MKELEHKHEAAQVAFEAAQKVLDTARLEYTEGPGKTYAETAARAAEIERLIAGQEQIREEAKQDLANKLRAAPSEVSVEAKNALAMRRDAEDLLEQYHSIKVEATSLAQVNLVEASAAAQSYISA